MSDLGKTTGWEAVSFDELESVPVSHGLVWHPVRKRLGIGAFGMNAYTSEKVGDCIVEEHTENVGDGGHEEIYIVIRGRATFTVDGATRNAPAGTMVFISDPSLRRSAIAEEADTLVLAVGGEAGKVYEWPSWEVYFSAAPALKAERWDEAIAQISEGLRLRPGNPGMLYNLACAESRGGHPLEALTHLQQAVHGDAKYRAAARTDPDFDPIRREPGFPA